MENFDLANEIIALFTAIVGFIAGWVSKKKRKK